MIVPYVSTSQNVDDFDYCCILAPDYKVNECLALTGLVRGY